MSAFVRRRSGKVALAKSTPSGDSGSDVKQWNFLSDKWRDLLCPLARVTCPINNYAHASTYQRGSQNRLSQGLAPISFLYTCQRRL